MRTTTADAAPHPHHQQLRAALADFPNDDPTILLLKGLVERAAGDEAEAQRRFAQAKRLGLPKALDPLTRPTPKTAQRRLGP